MQPPQTIGFPCSVGTPLGQLRAEQPAIAAITTIIIIAAGIADRARGSVFLGVAGSRAAVGMESLLCRGLGPASVVPAPGGAVGNLATPEEHVPAATATATVLRLHSAAILTVRAQRLPTAHCLLQPLRLAQPLWTTGSTREGSEFPRATALRFLPLLRDGGAPADNPGGGRATAGDLCAPRFAELREGAARDLTLARW